MSAKYRRKMMLRESSAEEDRRVAGRLIEEVGAEAAIALLWTEVEGCDRKVDRINANLRARDEALQRAVEDANEATSALGEKTKDLKVLATVLAVEHAVVWHGDPARAWL